MSTSSAHTPQQSEDTLSQVFKLYSSRNYACTIASPATHPYLVQDTVVFPLQGIPERLEEALTISGHSKHTDFLGEVAHLAGHLRHKDMQETILTLDEPVRSLAWHLEDARTAQSHLARREHDTLLLKTRFQTFLSVVSKIAAPTSFDYLVTWSAICARASSGLITPEEKASLRERLAPHLSPQVLDDAEVLSEEMIEMEAGDEEFGVRCLQLARLQSDWTLSPELHRQCVLEVQDPIEGGGQGGQGESQEKDDDDTSEVQPGDDQDSDEASPDSSSPEEGLDSEDDPNSEPSTPEDSDFEDDDSPTSAEKADTEQSAKDTPKEDTEESPLEDDLGDALDVPDNDNDVNLELPEYKAQQQKEREELAKFDNEALGKMKRAKLDKKGIKIPSRPPTQADIQLASKLALTFKKARWRAPQKIVRKSATPPGKLIPRAAVFSAAQRSMGLPVTAEPFRQTFKKREEGPPIILGLMCDVSGSMSASAEPMAQFAWACSRAVPKAGGEFAAVTFGHKVNTLVPLNSKMNAIPRFATKDGYEAAYDAILALAGGLGFFRPKEGVKVLVISSDGYWQQKEIAGTMKALALLKKMGVMVIWLPFTKGSGDYFGHKHEQMEHMQYGSVVHFDKMENAARELGKLIEMEARKA